MCNEHTALFYLKDYPLCSKHWDLHCDNRFKYKHFKSLREYLGFPPIEKPEGCEDVDEDYLSYSTEIQIDIETNSPVIMSESYSLWEPEVPAERPKHIPVQWNGKKEDPLELYIEIGNSKVVLLSATGKAVKFSSEKVIRAAMGKLQQALDIGTPGIDFRIGKLFKKSKFWKLEPDCQDKIEAAYA